jgi:organic radical activating enzyme
MFYNNQLIHETTNGWHTICWSIGNFCNFKCPYCFDTANLGTIKAPTFNQTLVDNADHLIQEVKRVMPKKNRLCIIFDGGEPTTWKDLPKLCASIRERHPDVQIKLTTNGSMPVKWWEKHIQVFDRITLSCHTYEADRDLIRDIVRVARDNLVPTSTPVLVGAQNYHTACEWFKNLDQELEERYNGWTNARLVPIRWTSRNGEFEDLTDDQYDHLSDLYKRRQQAKRSVPVDPVSKQYNDHQFKHLEPKRFFRKNSSTLGMDFAHDEKRLRGDWIGYKCFAPQQFIQVDYDAAIRSMSCGYRMFDERISLADPEFPNKFTMPEPIICEINAGIKCGCAGLGMSNKRITKIAKRRVKNPQ